MILTVYENPQSRIVKIAIEAHANEDEAMLKLCEEVQRQLGEDVEPVFVPHGL